MKCGRCGGEIQEGTNSCPACGLKIKTGVPEAGYKPPDIPSGAPHELEKSPVLTPQVPSETTSPLEVHGQEVSWTDSQTGIQPPMGQIAGPMPPSDAYAYPVEGYLQPPNRSAIRKKRYRALVKDLCILAILVVAAAVVWSIFKPLPAGTYTSRGTGISLKYPVNWKRFNGYSTAFSSGFKLPSNASIDLSVSNNNSASGRSTGGLVVMHFTGTAQRWDAIKATFRAKLDVSNDTTVAGMPALEGSVSTSEGGTPVEVQVVYLLHAKDVFFLGLVTLNPASPGQYFQNIVDSISFSH